MMEALIKTFIDIAQNNLQILMLTLWSCFAGYTTWYFTSANKYVPITSNEASILWKIHKRAVRCKAKKWREIRHGGKTVGFECECGYRHIQESPITASTIKPSVLGELHTAYQ